MKYQYQKTDNLNASYNKFYDLLKNLKAAQNSLNKGEELFNTKKNNIEIVKTNAIKIKSTTQIRLECSSHKIIVISKETIDNCMFNTTLNQLNLKEYFIEIGYEYLTLAIEVMRVFQNGNQYSSCDYLPFFNEHNKYNLYYDDNIIDNIVLKLFLKTFFEKSYLEFTEKVNIVSLSKRKEIEKERYYEDRLLTELLKPNK